jgi:hypothetical protein
MWAATRAEACTLSTQLSPWTSSRPTPSRRPRLKPSPRTGLDLGAARERVRVARALGRLPRLAQALAGGELSSAKVRALTRVATPETEERLLALGRVAPAAQVERIVRGWRQVDRRAEAAETARRHRARALSVYPDDDGIVVIRGRLEPEVGALVMRAGRRPRRRRRAGRPEQLGQSVLEDGVRVSAEPSMWRSTHGRVDPVEQPER